MVVGKRNSPTYNLQIEDTKIKQIQQIKCSTLESKAALQKQKMLFKRQTIY